MKNAQGTNIINPETIKIIRNLRQKGFIEKQDREYYINQMLADIMLEAHSKRLSKMGAIEEFGQNWCLKNGIVGYDYIWILDVGTKKP